VVERSVPAVPVEDTELGRVERELEEVRVARAAALDRSVRLAEAGNDVSASHAARAARDFATASRALMAEVALLRESHVRVNEAVLDRLVERLKGFLAEMGWSERHPTVAAGIQRWFSGEPPAVAVPPSEALSLPRSAQPQRGAAASGRVRPRPPHEEADVAEDEPSVAADVADDTSGDDEDSIDTSDDDDDTPVEPEPEPEPVELVELVEMAAVPAAWFARFKMDPAGRERCRVAYSTQLAKQRRAKQAREQAAKAADDAAAIERAAARAANPPSPLPSGWDRRGSGRFGGINERAGP